MYINLRLPNNFIQITTVRLDPCNCVVICKVFILLEISEYLAKKLHLTPSAPICQDLFLIFYLVSFQRFRPGAEGDSTLSANLRLFIILHHYST